MKISDLYAARMHSDQYMKQMQSVNPDKGYTMRNNTWPGLAKVVEESGEVLQLCGKIMSVRGNDIYYNGENLREELEDELGDLMASINYLIQENNLDNDKIRRRIIHKLDKYDEWKATNQ